MKASVQAWVHRLMLAKMQATTGLYLDPLNGLVQQGGVNPAAMWAPHRRVGTPARQHRNNKPLRPPSIRSAVRRGGEPVSIADPHKYLHAHARRRDQFDRFSGPTQATTRTAA
jgi:hypothetical protein